MISRLNGLHNSSPEKDLNRIHSNGSDSNNTEKVTQQNSSIMKSPTQDGTDTEDIWMIPRRLFTHSPMVTKTNHYSSISTLLPQKEERNSRKNGIIYAKWFQKCFQRKIWLTPMNKPSTFLMNPTSEEYGNITESTFSSSDTPILLKKDKSLNKTQITSATLLILQTSLHSISSYWQS